MKTISLKISEQLYNVLYQLSKKRGQTISSLIRETLNDYLISNNELNPSSFYVKAQDLIGCLEGPEDLSANEKYLQGYGKC